MKSGIAQCIAEMLAAQQFNAAKNIPLTSVYGAVTTGTAWRFFRLEGTTVYADDTEIPIETPERIVGIIQTVAPFP